MDENEQEEEKAMQTSVIGFPRIGTLRELKFASEKYFRNEIKAEELLQTAKDLRKAHWMTQKEAGITFISSNDFSHYDLVLDTAVLLGIVPKRYQELQLSALDTYFAMARGYQGTSGDVKALAMKKWFNTNYHYIVPEAEDDTVIHLSASKLFDEYAEAKELGIATKPVVIGAYTMLKLCRFTGEKKAEDFIGDLTAAYQELLKECQKQQIATVVSQAISCVLVLRCLYKSEGSYQLRFSKLCLKKDYIIPIFQVGIPAGIQSTVINFSNVLLQSSVNSFGSIAMAGYTAANNVLGFLYTSVNSVTQACMSFTSQNYGVGKYKRMDKVLIDCLILSSGMALVMGGGAYLFGTEILQIYTGDPEVIRCGMEILSITTVPYFLCGIMDLFPGALRGMGCSAVPMILSVIGTVGTRIVWIFGIFPQHRSLYVLFISYPGSWIITIIMQVICYLIVRKKVHSRAAAV